MVASVGAKYILKYSERLDKKESHLSADRRSLTNKKPPTFPYRLLCFPVGIPCSLQEAIIPYCKGIPLRVAALIKSNFFPCLLRFWYPSRISGFFPYPPPPPEVLFFYVPLPPEYPPNPLAKPNSFSPRSLTPSIFFLKRPAHKSKSLNTISQLMRSKCGERCTSFQSFEKFGARRGKRQSTKNCNFTLFS